MNEKPKKNDVKMSVAVWFDRTRDCLCVADRLNIPRTYTVNRLGPEGGIISENRQYEPGEAIPDEFTIRIPLLYGEEFVEAVFQMANTGSDFCKIMDGVQRLLDKRAVSAIEIAENLRAEQSKRSGGGAVGWNMNQLSVKADEFIKARELRIKLCEWLNAVDREEDDAGRIFLANVRDFMMEKGLYEPGQVPRTDPEETGEARPEE